jgi:crotonobetainyl-CoA:carnitine CoA-transferase CaiB-like acyl-CoA transferase
VIAALHARERTGAGQQATTSLASQSVLLQIGELTTYPGAPSPADGGRDCLGARALERYYECADGWIALACATPDHYAALAAALGLSRRDGHTAVAQPRDGDLAAEIAATLRPLARAAALERLRAAGAPAAPALRGPETFDDAYLAENGYFDVYEHGVLGPIKGVSGFALWGRSVAGFSRAAPELGEHSAEVLADYGVPAARVAALIGMGAVIVGPGEAPSAS